MQSLVPIRRALLSVSDKTGIVEFAKALSARDVELLSTGGTAKLLLENNIPVIEVSDYTQFPEMMDGRVKTLHPKIHGGILGRRDKDKSVMEQHQINPIDMVVVNLYPFEKTVAKNDCTLADAIENIDIGGPSMIRSAAKNHKDVAVVIDHHDYQTIIQKLDAQSNALDYQYKFNLAVKAFEHTAKYDGMIANYFGKKVPSYFADDQNLADNEFSRTINLQFVKKQDLRYGENSHQKAAFYIDSNSKEASIATAKQLQGKELSYNNIADTDAALECVKEFKQAACVIVKHANPCGVAVSDTIFDAYLKAYQTDPTSAFGGIIAFNQQVDAKTADKIISQQFVEVIIAPEFTADALAILSKKQNVRVLACGYWSEKHPNFDLKQVNGGVLAQDRDIAMVDISDLSVVSKRVPTKAELQDALFGWKVAKYVKSNAIVYAKNNQTIGIGAGQMSRVYSAKIATIKANDENLDVKGSVMASDAFFPFKDGIDAAALVGVSCVIHPGGSVRDQEVIDAANEHGMAMILTNMRHFRH